MKKEIGASSIARWIIKNNFPKEFEVLCYNCNCAKALNDYHHDVKQKNI